MLVNVMLLLWSSSSDIEDFSDLLRPKVLEKFFTASQ